MIYFLKSCENNTNSSDIKARLDGMCFKKIHLGIIKIWLKYELYSLINPKTNMFIYNEKTGKRFTGKNLSEIEVKWGWK